MTEYKSDLLRLLSERGHIHQLTDAQGSMPWPKEIVVAYNGYDATAPSLHVGNLASVMLLRRLQQAGHKPIALMGGGTTKIGDPSGKDTSRQMLTEEIIASQHRRHPQGVRPPADVRRQRDRRDHGQQRRLAVQAGLHRMLRTSGPHFTVNRMLTFDSVKLRLDREQPLTFLEFNYMILQAYDFRELALRHGCRLQFGGSDQWGNIVNGIELTRRMNGIEVFGATTRC
jgi:tyrosyl-tRNA synthetase